MKPFETQTIVNLGHICWTLLDLGQLWVTWLKSHCSSSLGFAGYFNIFHGSSWALIESSMPKFFLSEYWFPQNRLYKAHPLTRHEPSEGFQIFSAVGDTNCMILIQISHTSNYQQIPAPSATAPRHGGRFVALQKPCAQRHCRDHRAITQWRCEKCALDAGGWKTWMNWICKNCIS